MRLLFSRFALVVAFAMPPMQGLAFDTSAKAAIIIDMTTENVLLSKNADIPLPPASMSKLMTLYEAFAAIRDGRLSLDEKLHVSQHAMDYGGSTMFLDTTDKVKVEDLLRGIIVLSGNDACAVIAEALSPDGSEKGFARLLTERARNMGMQNSTFRNSNGWPEEGHVMSVRDLAIISRRIIEDFPEFYPMFAEREFEFDNRAPKNRWNRNPLLGLDIGADGLKTGHTQEAGYGLAASAIRDGRRILFVFSGLSSSAKRAEEASAIIDWAFRQFSLKNVFNKGDKIVQADVWMGKNESIELVVNEDVSMLVPAKSAGKLTAEVIYSSPVKAPVKKGDKLAELVFKPEGLPEKRFPLAAAKDVERGGFGIRIMSVFKLLWLRLSREV